MSAIAAILGFVGAGRAAAWQAGAVDPSSHRYRQAEQAGSMRRKEAAQRGSSALARRGGWLRQQPGRSTGATAQSPG
jgi:hypothetical protein